MENFRQDLLYGIRSLVKSPGFAVISTVTLALAIAVNTAIFSLINVIVFADLPMEKPEEVVRVRADNAARGITDDPLSFPEFMDYREQNSSFIGLAAEKSDQWILTGGDEPLRVDGYRVSDNFLDVWQMGTAAGRGFLPGEDRPGAAPVAILSHGFWTRHYGSRSEVVGSVIRLDDVEHTVIGVLSPKMEFANLAEAEVWLPLGLDRGNTTLDQRDLSVTGRLRPGTSVEQAGQDLAVLGARIAEEYPATNRGWEPRVVGVRESLLENEDKTIMLLLVLTVFFVLLIACANVANMLLVRATARGREMAVRAAMGANRLRIIRQLLTEASVIAVVATLWGLGLSRGLMQLLIRITEGKNRIFLMAELDGNVMIFMALICFIAPFAFGLLPALRASRGNVSQALNESSARSSGGRRGSRLRGILVGAQVALALMLMVVAGLIVRTVVNLQQLELGFEPAGVLSMRLDLPETKYSKDVAIRRFFHDTLEQVGGLPAVSGMALVSNRPAIEEGPEAPFEIEGRPVSDELERPRARRVVATPGYLDLMGIPVLRGRAFTSEDTEDSIPVVLVSREMAEHHWAGENPVGQRIRIGDESVWAQVVGIVGNVQNDEVSERPEHVLYRPFAQNVRSTMVAMVRSELEAADLAPLVRRQVWSLDPDQPIDDVDSMEQALYDEMSGAYALITLFVSFAFFALVMAGIGIYGVTSYSVAQQAQELGIHMAMGAEPAHVLRMVLRQGSKRVALGSLCGLAGAFLISRLLTSLLFGVSALDPLTFVGVSAVLISIAMLASYLPARRATRIDPVAVLRAQ